jgi:hypothetical protein
LPVGVVEVDRVAARVLVEIEPTGNPDRVFGKEALLRRVVIPRSIIV